ncbi:MAG: hypothetical protein HY315_06535 [Acidobacteria bacterium]|nr:hypothetical protein [Acidobacteriota bacterium]
MTLSAAALHAEESRWKFEGFWEHRTFTYFRPAETGETQAEADSHLRGKLTYQFKNMSLAVAPDLWIDSHGRMDRQSASLSDRTDRRPAVSSSELTLDFRTASLDLRVGKQQIVWGRADTWNPTDNVMPFDYLDLVETERIGVAAVRARRYFNSASLDLVWVPRFSPTRLPLLNARWYPRLQSPSALPLRFRSRARFPPTTAASSQLAIRWDHTAHGWDYSVSYFNGWNDIPNFALLLVSPAASSGGPATPSLEVNLQRSFRRIQVVGGDLAVTPAGLGVRAEAAFFRPQKGALDFSPGEDRDYLLYALGMDKSWGDWTLLAQVMGDIAFGSGGAVFPPQAATLRFPDRGLGHSLLGRLEQSTGPRASWSLTAVVRLQAGDSLLEPEYQYQLAQAWKLSAGVHLLVGSRTDFLGQYRNNSRVYIKLRQSF